MKRIFAVICLICFMPISFGLDSSVNKKTKMPQGTFKKHRNGNIIQYDSNGKKIGVYKISNGKYVKIK